jgi:hypothetical protein
MLGNTEAFFKQQFKTLYRQGFISVLTSLLTAGYGECPVLRNTVF